MPSTCLVLSGIDCQKIPCTPIPCTYWIFLRGAKYWHYIVHIDVKFFTDKCSLHSTRPVYVNSVTLLQKRKEARFWFPATIPAPYEPPGSGLSENIKIKKIYGGTLIYYILHSKNLTFQPFGQKIFLIHF